MNGPLWEVTVRFSSKPTGPSASTVASIATPVEVVAPLGRPLDQPDQDRQPDREEEQPQDDPTVARGTRTIPPCRHARAGRRLSTSAGPVTRRMIPRPPGRLIQGLRISRVMEMALRVVAVIGGAFLVLLAIPRRSVP